MNSNYIKTRVFYSNQLFLINCTSHVALLRYISVENRVVNSHIFTRFYVNLKTVIIEASEQYYANLEKKWKKQNKTKTKTSNFFISISVTQGDNESNLIFQFPIPSKFKFNKICPMYKTDLHQVISVGSEALKSKNTIKMRETHFHKSLKVLWFHGIMCKFHFMRHKCLKTVEWISTKFGIII